MPSKLLLNLRNGFNIEKLVAFEFEQVKKDGYLVAIPCQEYTINGETYTAIGTVYDHSKLDSMLNLGDMMEVHISSCWMMMEILLIRTRRMTFFSKLFITETSEK